MNTDVTFIKSMDAVYQCSQRAGSLGEAASEMKEEIASGLPAGPTQLKRDQNIHVFRDTSGRLLCYLQAKYFFNWQQLGIYNRNF